MSMREGSYVRYGTNIHKYLILAIRDLELFISFSIKN
jgi:hypothetical protein